MRRCAHIQNGLVLAITLGIAMLIIGIPISSSFHVHHSVHGTCSETQAHTHDLPQGTAEESCEWCAFYTHFVLREAVHFPTFSWTLWAIPGSNHVVGLRIGSPSAAFADDNAIRGPPVSDLAA